MYQLHSLNYSFGMNGKRLLLVYQSILDCIESIERKCTIVVMMLEYNWRYQVEVLSWPWEVTDDFKPVTVSLIKLSVKSYCNGEI